jgi:type IV secretory pathway protease TraF
MRTLELIGIAVGLALVAPHPSHLPARVVYNPSDSAPRGWYRIEAFPGIQGTSTG